VATTGGAIPEVAGPDGETCLAVPPGDAGALAAAEDGETHEGVPAAGGTVETNRESANRESRATC
ncbi:glycosyltransferase family 1 protein, partial [Streptomyces scabiei]|nr:glycosyltransferase family 1 protein [Streptomyces scabiei]